MPHDATIPIEIRRASSADSDALHALQAHSMRVLCRDCYDPVAIEGFIAHVGTMDDVLLTDGTYLAAYCGDELVGCGGWTMRVPNYLAHSAPNGVSHGGKATVRSLFVHPDWARRGIARRLMERIEAEIAEAGESRATLGATLTGLPFYRRLGYRGSEPVVLRLPGDIAFVAIELAKSIGGRRSLDLAA